MKKFKLNTGMFKAECWVLIGDIKTCTRWVQKYQYTNDKFENNPQVIPFPKRRYYVLLGKRPIRKGLLVHELSHLVTFLLKGARIDNDEARSLLLDFFVDQVLINCDIGVYRYTRGFQP